MRYSLKMVILLAQCLVPTFLFGLTTINDFSHLNKTTVSTIYYPSSIEEIHAIIENAKKSGKKVSTAGKRHSQGGHAFYPDNVVIDTKNFNKIIGLNQQEKIITVQTGATWEQIQEFINPYKLAIKVMQTTQIFTVGGSLSVNAHGRDPKFGPLIETIKAIRIMLSSGEIIQASRTENYELFKLAIGGYGLFGIILEADIELTDNIVYKKKAQVIRIKDYPTFVEDNVIDNPTIGLHYGIICLAPYDHFKKILVINYTNLPASKKIPSQAYHLEEERFVNISKQGLNLRRQSRLFNFYSELGEWPFVIMREKLAHTTCRNNAMRHPVKCVEHAATKNTDVLQSYLIPTHSFTDFMAFLKKCAHDKDLKILYALTRYIPKNNESFLSYTPDNYFEIVLFVNHGITQDEVAHAQAWTQKVINEVLSYGGKFYLPVRLNASYEQLHQAYPQIDEFFIKKRQYDPDELFINYFYKTYTSQHTEKVAPANQEKSWFRGIIDKITHW